MPANRNALIRYKTIDLYLQNRYRKWTLEELIDACSEALYEYEGIDKGVSKRTVQMDIQMMRSDKLGYNAPIVVVDRKYYTYEDPDYSITNIPLTDQDLGKLAEVVEILKQFKGFKHFQDLSGIVQRLEDKVYSSQTNQRPIINLEKNEHLKGLEHIDTIYSAIQQKLVLTIGYKSFKATEMTTFTFHPFLLKEYRNRWFVLGKKKVKQAYQLLALDRIEHISLTDRLLMDFDEVEVSQFFQEVVGVTVNEGDEVQEVILFIDASNAPYVLTKPIHHSQQLLEQTERGITISLRVKLNFELEREILGFGDHMKVIKPQNLKKRINRKLIQALDLYRTELKEHELVNFPKRLASRGYVEVNQLYTRKEVGKMAKLIHHYVQTYSAKSTQSIHIQQLFRQVPNISKLILNDNLRRILSHLAPSPDHYEVCQCEYLSFPASTPIYDSLQQDIWGFRVEKRTDSTPERKDQMQGENFFPIYGNETENESFYKSNISIETIKPLPTSILEQFIVVVIYLTDVSEETGGLLVLPGSHRKILTDRELTNIKNEAMTIPITKATGSILIMNPLLLRVSASSTSQKKQRMIRVLFCPSSLSFPMNKK